MTTKLTTIIELESTSEDGKKAEKGSKPAGQWLAIFNQLADLINQDESRGQKVVNLQDLKNYMRQVSAYQIEYDTGMAKDQLLCLVNKLKKADKNQDGTITLPEWEDWVQRTQAGPKILIKNDKVNKVLNVVGYAPIWTCRPPTIFIALMSFLQVLFYLLQTYAPESMGVVNGRIVCTYFIYNPHHRSQVWRFFTYMFIHGGATHISMNILIQLFVGVPLEMSQPGWVGTGRVALVYFSGVIFGVLGASVCKPKTALCGASAGVYALIWAHLATLILNWKEDGEMYQKRKEEGAPKPFHLNKFIRGTRLAFVIFWFLFDLSLTLYNIYGKEGGEQVVSIEGHAFGGLAGVLVGLFVLHNRKVEDWERIFKIVMLSLFGMAMLGFILTHIFAESRFPKEGVIPKACNFTRDIFNK